MQRTYCVKGICSTGRLACCWGLYIWDLLTVFWIYPIRFPLCHPPFPSPMLTGFSVRSTSFHSNGRPCSENQSFCGGQGYKPGQTVWQNSNHFLQQPVVTHPRDILLLSSLKQVQQSHRHLYRSTLFSMLCRCLSCHYVIIFQGRQSAAEKASIWAFPMCS